MTVACPDCERALSMLTDGYGECYNCNVRYETAQCDGCGDQYTQPEMTTENAPGAMLWWCPDCATTRGVAYE